MPFRSENRPTTLALLAIVVSIMLVGAGMLFYLAEREDDRRQAAAAARDAADRRYADCLTEFAADLVETIETRTAASAKLERVSVEKDQTLDTLLRITALARRNPPEATERQFDAALAARVAAQARYDEVAAQVAEVREENQYQSPKVVCSR